MEAFGLTWATAAQGLRPEADDVAARTPKAGGRRGASPELVWRPEAEGGRWRKHQLPT